MSMQEDRVVLCDKGEEKIRPRHPATHPLAVAMFVFLCIAAVVGVTAYAVVIEFTLPDKPHSPDGNKCDVDTCVFTLVESIPQNLTYPDGSPSHLSTFAGIQQILSQAQNTVEIASFYWTMRGEDIKHPDPSDWEEVYMTFTDPRKVMFTSTFGVGEHHFSQGESLFTDLLLLGQKKGIEIRIVQSKPKGPVNDTIDLAKYAGAKVRSLDMDRLVGAGILHTKMWLIDRKHFYVGSANLDWRSFTQVKELGAVVSHCSCMAEDIGKIFDAYWYLASPTSWIPPIWPAAFTTHYNYTNPLEVELNGTEFMAYLSSSPPPLCASGRSVDIDAITGIILVAEEFIHIAVMDYFPTTQFIKPRKYWPVIDDALRSAAFDRKIEVHLLTSYWNDTWDDMIFYLKSLQQLYSIRWPHVNIRVKMFVVPAYTEAQRSIPFARVNHNKYMVTDKTAYIGTSNWSGDYFISTGGIGLVVGQPRDNSTSVDVRQQLEDVFQRDWYSEYAFDLDHFNTTQRRH